MSRRTGGREARVRERSSSHISAPAFIRRHVMPYDLLSPDGLDLIEAKAD
jgi:trimethylamine:corrinoid methyltransferase-like protein